MDRHDLIEALEDQAQAHDDWHRFEAGHLMDPPRRPIDHGQAGDLLREAAACLFADRASNGLADLNIGANGRITMLGLGAIALFDGDPFLAVMLILSIGLAYVAEQIPPAWPGRRLTEFATLGWSVFWLGGLLTRVIW